MRQLLFRIVLFLLTMPLPAWAQVPIAPRTMTFAHPDSEFAITSGYHVDFFQCASVTAPNAANPQGVCVGRATAPFQAGADILKASVTGTAAARVIDLTAAPPSGVLSAMPAGVGFVVALTALGDTAVPGVTGNSSPAPDSNPFFSKARTPASPGKPSIP